MRQRWKGTIKKSRDVIVMNAGKFAFEILGLPFYLSIFSVLIADIIYNTPALCHCQRGPRVVRSMSECSNRAIYNKVGSIPVKSKIVHKTSCEHNGFFTEHQKNTQEKYIIFVTKSVRLLSQKRFFGCPRTILR